MMARFIDTLAAIFLPATITVDPDTTQNSTTQQLLFIFTPRFCYIIYQGQQPTIVVRIESRVVTSANSIQEGERFE